MAYRVPGVSNLDDTDALIVKEREIVLCEVHHREFCSRIGRNKPVEIIEDLTIAQAKGLAPIPIPLGWYCTSCGLRSVIWANVCTRCGSRIVPPIGPPRVEYIQR